ncbi:hypothetical protein MX029_10230 [Enterobacter cloacae subsp. cloacae]|nr:hypothetical protein [Enterobacter cloacae]MCK1071467.1 hypothetical protein [Enterobacter cloacae subsp. cloacae]
MPNPVSALKPVLPLINPDSVLVILIADDDSLMKIPFSAPVIFPLLLKSPSKDSTFTAFALVEEIVAPTSFSTTTRWAPVLISRPLAAPDILPLFVTDVTSIPDTDTAALLLEEEIVTSLLITYSVSAEKSCGTEVDCSIIPAEVIAGVNANMAGNSLPSILVVLLSSMRILLMHTSI